MIDFRHHALFFGLQVTLTDEVEIWLSKIRDSVCKSIREMNINVIQDCINGVAIDEWASKVTSIFFLFTIPSTSLEIVKKLSFKFSSTCVCHLVYNFA